MSEPLQAQLEAILAEIEERTPRECEALCATRGEPWHAYACNVRHTARVRTEIARTVYRMGEDLVFVGREGSLDQAWAAAVRTAEVGRAGGTEP